METAKITPEAAQYVLLDQMDIRLKHLEKELIPDPSLDPFSVYPDIDLTTAHTDMSITAIRPYDYIQIWADGPLDGITIKLGDPAKTPYDISRTPGLSVPAQPEKIYFTNDVRQGRSRAVIYFVRGNKPLTLNYGGQDIPLGELAVRTGSIDTFDRRGQIMLTDDFQGSLNHWTITAANGGYAVISSARAKTKDASLKLKTGSANANNVELIRYIKPVTLSKIGVEFSFTVDQKMSRVENGFELDDGDIRYNPIVDYYYTNGRIQLVDSNSVWHTIATTKIPLSTDSLYFNSLKVVINPVTGYYSRIILNNYLINVSQYKMPILATTTTQYLKLDLIAVTSNIGASTIYLSDVIVTHNEP
jgi:hypothetical protein